MRTCAKTLAAEMTTNEHELLLRVLTSQSGLQTCLEIGTAAGGTLCAMMGAYAGRRCPKFVVVDPLKYFPNQLETIQRNLKEHQLDVANVDFRQATSATAFPKAVRRGDLFDFILVDGCHRIGSVMFDLQWTRLLKVGGLICFHDYAPKFPGVTLCVDRLLNRHSNYVLVERADSLVVIQKNCDSAMPEIDFADRVFAIAWSIRHRITRKVNQWRHASAAGLN